MQANHWNILLSLLPFQKGAQINNTKMTYLQKQFYQYTIFVQTFLGGKH